MKIYVDLDHVDITEYTQIESGEYNTNKINFIFTPEYKDLVKVAIFESSLNHLKTLRYYQKQVQQILIYYHIHSQQ